MNVLYSIEKRLDHLVSPQATLSKSMTDLAQRAKSVKALHLSFSNRSKPGAVHLEMVPPVIKETMLYRFRALQIL